MNPSSPEFLDTVKSISDADGILQCYNRAVAIKFIISCRMKNTELIAADVPGTFRPIQDISDDDIFDRVKLYRDYLLSSLRAK